MYTIVEDIYLQESTFPCSICGAENYSYHEERYLFDNCIECKMPFRPNPHSLKKTVEYRVFYHFFGKDMIDGQKEEGF
jgi:hypothetical protein